VYNLTAFSVCRTIYVTALLRLCCGIYDAMTRHRDMTSHIHSDSLSYSIWLDNSDFCKSV